MFLCYPLFLGAVEFPTTLMLSPARLAPASQGKRASTREAHSSLSARSIGGGGTEAHDVEVAAAHEVATALGVVASGGIARTDGVAAAIGKAAAHGVAAHCGR